jgi:hypothetical protein
MQESLAWLRDPAPDLDLAGVLIGLILEIRRIVVHPDLQLDGQLLAIMETVDLLAPPPRADGSTGPATLPEFVLAVSSGST